MHPADLGQLSHPGVYERETGASGLPRLEALVSLLVGVQSDAVELAIPVVPQAVWPVIEDVGVEVAEGELAEVGLRAPRGSVATLLRTSGGSRTGVVAALLRTSGEQDASDRQPECAGGCCRTSGTPTSGWSRRRRGGRCVRCRSRRDRRRRTRPTGRARHPLRPGTTASSALRDSDPARLRHVRRVENR